MVASTLSRLFGSPHASVVSRGGIMRRGLLAAALILGCAAVTVAAIEYRFDWDAPTDIEVRTPCGLVGIKTAQLTFYSPEKAYLLFTCQDERVFVREVAPFIDDVPSTPVPSVLVSCPTSGHRACSCLPAGAYPSAWLDTVGCGR